MNKTWSKIGYGTWPLAGNVNGSISYGKVDEIDSIKALMSAFSSGINIYDTADFYGYGYVESLIGKTFESVRDEISIITKGGMISNEGNQNFSVAHLSNSLSKSLERLKTNYIDVYMLHSPKLEVLDEKLLWWLQETKKMGLIKEYGISLRVPEDGFDAINKFGFRIIEVNYNILDHRAQTLGLFDLCKEKGVKTIIRTPLGQGILSGKFKFSDDKADRRNNWKPEYVDKVTGVYKRMMSSLLTNPYTDAQNCLRFCLSNPAVCTIIPGMKLVDEVKENLQSQKFALLSDCEINRLTEIYIEEKL